MFAAVTFGFIGPLIDAIDWGKLAGSFVVLAAVPVLYAIARGLAKHGVRTELDNLRAKSQNAADALRNAEATIAADKIDVATRNQTIAFHEQTITQQLAESKQKQSELDKVFAAGQKLYREVIPLRLVRAEHERLKALRAAGQARIRELEDGMLTADGSLSALRDELARREKLLDQGERRMSKARRLRGYLLQAKALQARPKFRPIEDRKRAIISVLNLKGGVGKTTLTAHLGAALARKGYRVLLVDLDLQGSLTGLMLPPELINYQFKGKKLMQDYLLNASTRPVATPTPEGPEDLSLGQYVVPVPLAMPVPGAGGRAGSLSIVPASDDLAYAELNLTLGWLLRQGERDARFLLRKALHMKGANRAFDIVLLDCPPLLNISCVNALAASDYLLIPTLLSNKAVERVPALLKAVGRPEFVTHVNPHLKVMGVVANRTRVAQPTGNEAVLWNRLPDLIRSVRHTPTKMFESIVGQDAAISANELQFDHPRPGSRSDLMFTSLVNELEGELPDACRRV